MGGGGKPQVPNAPEIGQGPEVGTAGGQFGSAIEAELGALSQRLGAEQQFAPKFAEINVSQLEQFAPRLAGLTERLNPEAFAAQKLLGERIRGGLESGLDPATEAFFKQQFSAQEGAAGRLGSPIGSLNIARNLVRERLANQARLEQQLSGLAAGVPTLGGDLTGASLGGGPGLTGQFVSPQLQLGGSLAGTRANIFGTRTGGQASIFGTQGGIFGERERGRTTRRGQNIQLGSDIIGGVLGAVGEAKKTAATGGLGG